VQLLRAGDFSHQLTSGFVQQELVLNSAVQIFVTALFERSVFKYKDRGYRFVLLEAGHFAQNLNLAATALGFGVINVGGFFDRVLDDFLNLDGISHATIYAQVVGAHGSTPAEITW
jgi:SagB-type dehydrogenase family enzyme